MEGRFIDSYRDIVGAAVSAFKDPRARRKAKEEAIGLICGHGPKAITSSIRWNGREHLDWSSDYKLFSRAKWSHDEMFGHIVEEALGCDSGMGRYAGRESQATSP